MSNRKKQKMQIDKSQQIRQATPEDRVAFLRGTKVERTFTLERDGIDQEARTAWMSISSEEPYERYWGVEILDHKLSSINTGRMNSGAPLLVGHDPADQVGVVEKFEVTSEKRLRILARFGRSARAEEIFRDVTDGIRRNTSVGYMINDLVLESKSGDVATYRVTDWTPYEGSLVSIPADPTVGVGRQAEEPEVTVDEMTQLIKKAIEEYDTTIKAASTQALQIKQTEEIKMSDTTPVVEVKAAPIDTAAIQAQAQSREMQRQNDLRTLGDNFKEWGGVEIATALCRDPNGNLDMLKSQVLEKMKAVKALPLAEPAPQPYGTISMKYHRAGPLKAFRDLALDNGKTMKAEEAAWRSAHWMRAVFHGDESAEKWCRENGVQTRVMHGGSNSAGGVLVPVEMEQAIIDLRDEYGVARRLCHIRPMASDQLQIPRRTGGTTAYFTNDSTSTDVTKSDKSWDNVNLVAKKLMAETAISSDWSEDTMINAVDDLAKEMAYAFTLKEDNCYLIGDGTSTYGGMLGLKPAFEATAYSSRITLATGHDLFSEVDASDISLVMAGIAAYAKRGSVFLCSESAKQLIFSRLKASAGGNTVGTLGMPASDEYLGYPIITSEVLPSANTTLASKAMFFFGNFAMASSFGVRRGIEVQLLREVYASKGQIGVLSSERFDIVNHDLGSTSVKGPISAAYGA